MTCPVGYATSTDFLNLRLVRKENATATGPIRPINIRNIITIFPRFVKSGVIPIDKPTVPKAENVSKAIVKKSAFSKMLNKSIPVNTIVNDKTMTDSALRAMSRLTFLLNKVRFSRLRISVTTIKTTNAKVVVLIPPAVPPGEPPINIKAIIINCVAGYNTAMFNVEKPAVRNVTD